MRTRTLPTAPEITAAVKVLARDHEAEYRQAHDDWWRAKPEGWHAPLAIWEPEPMPPTVKDIAKLVLEAAEEKRQGQAKWAAVLQFRLHDGELRHVVIAPFSTELQAKKAGEGSAINPVNANPDARFMAVKIVNKPAEAWPAIAPPAPDRNEWIRKSIEDQDHFEYKEKW